MLDFWDKILCWKKAQKARTTWVTVRASLSVCASVACFKLWPAICRLFPRRPCTAYVDQAERFNGVDTSIIAPRKVTNARPQSHGAKGQRATVICCAAQQERATLELGEGRSCWASDLYRISGRRLNNVENQKSRVLQRWWPTNAVAGRLTASLRVMTKLASASHLRPSQLAEILIGGGTPPHLRRVSPA